MTKLNRWLGGVFLISGTSIGAGMLALPMVTYEAGFIYSFFGLIICWAFMFSTARLILHVNLSIPGNTNMITMSEKTLGVWGKGFCWITYLLLLYSLTAAYISGISPLIVDFITWLFRCSVPSYLGPLPLIALFGAFVYLGTKSVDTLNRIFIVGLIISYFGLIVFLPNHVYVNQLYKGEINFLLNALPILVTSFGFHIVIPSLTSYLNRDEKMLESCLFWGSLIPLVVYILWEALILGAISPEELKSAFESGNAIASVIASSLNNKIVISFGNFFTIFAILTSLLGVSMSLSDFLGDGFKLHRFSLGREIACILTFVPPLMFALMFQRGFTLALSYAGVFVCLLLGILPIGLAWRLPRYRSLKKKALLLVQLSFFVGIIILCFI
jgi:tyrosine-specific transport protein